MKQNKTRALMKIALTGVIGLGLSTALTPASPTAFAKSSSTAPQTVIKVWSFYPMQSVIAPFEKRYPNIKVDFTEYPSATYQQKLQSSLQTGVNAPDVFALEISFEQYYINLPQLENLSAPPYNAAQYLKGMYPYVDTLSKDSSEQIKALTFQATPGGIWFRRDLAKKYLGTDNPAQVSAKVSTWPKLMALGEKVYKESHGKVHLLSSDGDFFNMMHGAVKEPWVVNNKLVIDPAWIKSLDLSRESYVHNVDARLGNTTSSSGIAASMKNGTVMMYAEPSWYLYYDIMADAPGTKGKWGLANSPVPFWGGGTWMGMYSGSQEKSAAWQFIKYYTTDKQFLVSYMKESADYTSSMAADAALAKNYSQPFLDGQNSMAVLNRIAKTVKTSHVSQYDSQINTIFQNDALPYIYGEETLAKMLQGFKQDVHNSFPNVQTN